MNTSLVSQRPSLVTRLSCRRLHRLTCCNFCVLSHRDKAERLEVGESLERMSYGASL